MGTVSAVGCSGRSLSPPSGALRGLLNTTPLSHLFVIYFLPCVRVRGHGGSEWELGYSKHSSHSLPFAVKTEATGKNET
uniref:Uncharacterized protein n=1 Tax=Pan paniscus TaxID=9597 RepID=A0A2R9AIS6_PANPA